MANGHGGYRRPANPAPISGPGAHSRRTDGGPGHTDYQSISTVPNQGYGDRKAQADAQRIAPMAGKEPLPTPTPVSQPAEQPMMPAYSGGAFGAPSSRPNEPITAGADFGDGPGSDVLFGGGTVAPASGSMTQLLQQMSATDTTGLLGQLYQMARQRGV